MAKYADALDDIGSAVTHFGRGEEGEQETLREHFDQATKTLDQLEDRIHHTPLESSPWWPAYGALIIDATGMVHELEASLEIAAVPTEKDPVRRKIFRRSGSLNG